DDTFRCSATTITLPNASEPSCLVRLSPRAGGSVEIAHALAAGLSKRECGVAMLLSEGHRNKEGARRLGISEHTARRHTESILRKLGIASRSAVGAALRARHE